MKKFALIVFVFVLLGCATTYGYKSILNTWVGDNGDNLIRSWGPPTQQTKLSDGSSVFEYIRQGQAYVPQYTTPAQMTTTIAGRNAFTATSGGQTFGGYSVGLYCQTLFYISKDGLITGWKFDGNSCVN